MRPIISPVATTRSALAVLVLFLASCAAAPPTSSGPEDLHLPRRLHVTLQMPGQNPRDALLVVQNEGQGATRWSLFDPLGMPLARRILQKGKWRNDGFMRPDGEVNDMFSAILFAWTPAQSLPKAYASMSWHNNVAPDGSAWRTLDNSYPPRWRVVWASLTSPHCFTITRADGGTWQVEPLKGTP